MKRFTSILSLFLTGVMIMSFVGCVAPKATDSTTSSSTASGTTTTTTTTATTVPAIVVPNIGVAPLDQNVFGTQRNRVNVVEEWGVRSGEGQGQSNSRILSSKLSTVSANTDVVFPEGIYELSAPMELRNRQNVRIVGENATLIRTNVTNTTRSSSSSGFFKIRGCQTVSVQGFAFEYSIPTSLSGKVIAKNGTEVTLEITSTTHFTGNEYITIFNTFTAAGVPDKVLEQYATNNFPAEKLSENTLRVTGLEQGGVSRLSIGTKVCLRLSTGSDYVVDISGSENLYFSDLTMYASLNGGIIVGGRCKNLSLRNVVVTPKTAENLMSLNADALHISALGGTLDIQNCRFERPGDDCVNVHDMAYTVESVSGKEATVSAPRFSFSSTWGKTGDVIDFYNNINFAYLGSATITATSGQTYTFDTIPEGVGAGTVISNKTMHPSVLIRNTTVAGNRARGFLLQTENVVIEGCSFKDTALAAILLAPDLQTWYEMGPAKNVLIYNNTFENCGKQGVGVIQASVSHDSASKIYSSYVHQTIVVQNNTFIGNSKPAFYGVCIDGLYILGNTYDSHYGSHVGLNRCTNVKTDEQ